MILVRNTFQLKFGKAKDAIPVFKEGKEINKKLGNKDSRVLTDLTGKAYTIVLEITFASLTDLEQSLQRVFGSKEWAEWYQKVIPLVDSSYRDIFNIVE
jgi:hypothetical protein